MAQHLPRQGASLLSTTLGIEVTVYERVYVRVVDGTTCYVPLPVEHVGPDKYRFLDNEENDPADTSVLLEFLPGDTVVVESKCFGATDPSTAQPIAVSLVETAIDEIERAYWALLFSAVWPADSIVSTESQAAGAAVARIASEVDGGSKWHYPAAKEWIEHRRKA